MRWGSCGRATPAHRASWTRWATRARRRWSRGCPVRGGVDPAQLGRPFTGRTALLSPFDRLVHDRTRLADLFEFEYVLEMYKPRNQRRWGYFSLPVLHGDRLIGKVDATADRRNRVLRVDAVHEDHP